MSAHTPGPWIYRGSKDSLAWTVEISTPDNPRCIEVEGRSDVEADANARLIAAAPDLLAACKAALNDRMYKDWPNVADLLISAIAKAEGR